MLARAALKKPCQRPAQGAASCCAAFVRAGLHSQRIHPQQTVASFAVCVSVHATHLETAVLLLRPHLGTHLCAYRPLPCRYQAVVVRAYNGDPLETEDGQEAPAAEPGSPEAAGKATTACWIGRHGNCFATGHEAGDVFVWGLPKSCQTGGMAWPG